MLQRHVVLLAGPSGSGKSRLARTTGAAQVRLDDFYLDEGPELPKIDGLTDWDDVATWDATAAVTALQALLEQGRCEVPDYSIARSARVGTRELDLVDDKVVVAEGIFAIDLLDHCQRAGLAVTPIWLDRPRTLNFGRRLVRDLRKHRKPPLVLLQRGARLFRDEPGLRAKAVRAGFQPLSMRAAISLVHALGA